MSPMRLVAAAAIGATALLSASAAEAHAQVHAITLQRWGGSETCTFPVVLTGAQQGTGLPTYSNDGLLLPVVCPLRVDINWTALPYQARLRLWTWNSNDPDAVAEQKSWTAEFLESKQGTQTLDAKLTRRDVFRVSQAPTDPNSACRRAFVQLTSQGNDPKELLADGFQTTVFAMVRGEPQYIPGGQSTWMDSGKTAQTSVNVRLQCGGNATIANNAFPAPPPPQRQPAFRVTGAALLGYLGNAAVPLTGRVETSCPAQLRLVGSFDHVGRTPGEIRSRLRWTGGPVSTQLTTPVPHPSDHMNYVTPQVVLTVPVPLPSTLTAQPQPQGGFVVVQPAQGAQMAAQTVASNEHRGVVRVEVLSTQGVVSNPFEYHIVCTSGPGGGAGQPNMAIPTPTPPPGAPTGVTGAPPPANPPATPATPAVPAAPSVRAGADAYAGHTYVIMAENAGPLGGFMQLDQAAGRAVPGAARLTLSRGSADVAALRRAIGSGASIVVVRREGGVESCRLTLSGAAVAGVRNERSRDQVQLALTARRMAGDCR